MWTEGWQEWRDRNGPGETGRASSRELTPIPKLELSHIDSLCRVTAHCSPLVRGIHLLPSLVQCFLQKPPERLQTSVSPLPALSLSLRRAFLDAKKEMTWGRGGAERKALKNENLLSHHPFPSIFSPSCTHSHTIPSARLFPVPDPFFLFSWPVTHCAGKSDFLFSQGSKLKAQPQPPYEKSHSRAFG